MRKLEGMDADTRELVAAVAAPFVLAQVLEEALARGATVVNALRPDDPMLAVGGLGVIGLAEELRNAGFQPLMGMWFWPPRAAMPVALDGTPTRVRLAKDGDAVIGYALDEDDAGRVRVRVAGVVRGDRRERAGHDLWATSRDTEAMRDLERMYHEEPARFAQVAQVARRVRGLEACG